MTSFNFLVCRCIFRFSLFFLVPFVQFHNDSTITQTALALTVESQNKDVRKRTKCTRVHLTV